MAVLKKILVRNFKNISLAELSFSSNINCISGGNGEGKTNLLDAVYYMSMTKSAINASERYNFQFGSDSFSISATYDMPNGTESRFAVSVDSKGNKKIKRDDKFYSRLSDHIGVLPVVVVSPFDTSLVSDSGEDRRRFLNAVISQVGGEYLANVQQYNKLLVQRNTLLHDRRADEDLLSVFDARMSTAADAIYAARKRFVEELSPVAASYYGILSGGKEQVSIAYKSDLDKAPLSEIFSANREKDKFLGYTSSGIQRDDLVFSLDGHPIRRIGSQGQQKSFLVALKFAQYDLMKESLGTSPILLLDDVFDKLDMDRISNLLKLVAGKEFGQIFITDSNKLRLSGIVDGITDDRKYFVAEGGKFEEN